MNLALLVFYLRIFCISNNFKIGKMLRICNIYSLLKNIELIYSYMLFNFLRFANFC